ncbi:MAG TPA: adenylyl-sulfate reductase subunit beta, partial [Spirochaetes bacterium]|nr:adenylyl-sulfate reductase subunit beta [Spirochaetota bacterium]
IRTTPEGSIEPYAGKPEAGDINDQRLFTQAGQEVATNIE